MPGRSPGLKYIGGVRLPFLEENKGEIFVGLCNFHGETPSFVEESCRYKISIVGWM